MGSPGRSRHGRWPGNPDPHPSAANLAAPIPCSLGAGSLSAVPAPHLPPRGARCVGEWANRGPEAASRFSVRFPAAWLHLGLPGATQPLRDLPPGNKAPPVLGLGVCLRPRKAILPGSESVLPRKVSRHLHLPARPGETETSRLPADPPTTPLPSPGAQSAPQSAWFPRPPVEPRLRKAGGGGCGCEGNDQWPGAVPAAAAAPRRLCRLRLATASLRSALPEGRGRLATGARGAPRGSGSRRGPSLEMLGLYEVQ